MAPRKVIPMPEAQFVGSLERQVDRLAGEAEEAVREGDRRREPKALVAEAQRLLRAGARALSRPPKHKPRRPRRK